MNSQSLQFIFLNRIDSSSFIIQEIQSIKTKNNIPLIMSPNDKIDPQAKSQNKGQGQIKLKISGQLVQKQQEHFREDQKYQKMQNQTTQNDRIYPKSSQSQNSSQEDDEVKQKTAFMVIDQERLIQKKNKVIIRTANMHQKITDLVKENTQGLEKPNQYKQQSDQESQALDEDEIDAFLYILSVRKQKKQLLQNKKERKAQQKHMREIFQAQNLNKKQKKALNDDKDQQNINMCLHNQNQYAQKCQISQHLQVQKQFLRQFGQQVTSNFDIMVQNVRYLIKNKSIYSQNSKKFNTKLYQSLKLDKQPKIYQLMRLTIGQVQDAMRKICFQLTYGLKSSGKINKKDKQKKTETQIKSKQKKNQLDDDKIITEKDSHINQQQDKNANQDNHKISRFCLWIYSLLALHQGWSSYSNFSSLGEINFILIGQIQSIKDSNQSIKDLYQSKNNQNQSKNDQNQSGKNWDSSKINANLSKMNSAIKSRKQLLVILILMVNKFQQRHLQKYLFKLLTANGHTELIK